MLHERAAGMGAAVMGAAVMGMCCSDGLQYSTLPNYRNCCLKRIYPVSEIGHLRPSKIEIGNGKLLIDFVKMRGRLSSF